VVFGWSGGSKLVKDSYADAKVKAAEMKEDRSQMLGGDDDESAGSEPAGEGTA
jgi:hypothetical protein